MDKSIVFVSNTCSEEVYKKVFNERNKKIIDPMQKFLLQVMEGVSEHEEINSISLLPISASNYPNKEICRNEEVVNSIHYIYPSFKNGRINRFISSAIAVYKTTYEVLKHNNNSVVITDPLNPYISIPARLCAHIKKMKAVAIITDLPLFATNMKERKESQVKKLARSIYETISNIDSKRYDGYIFLTNSMNEVVNKKNKPYIVMEGTAVDKADGKKILSNSNKKIFLYAGGIYEKYGIKNLVEAFVSANLNDAELHIYGEGEYVRELIDVCKRNKNVHYKGCILNSELLLRETEADLLINPRFSKEEYTKYSFPSKTLEYLSSGTAVLSTRLKGIPNEYNEYLFWFDDESIEGMKNKLSEIDKIDRMQLSNIGQIGRKFVLKNKSASVQGKRIIDFIEHI